MQPAFTSFDDRQPPLDKTSTSNWLGNVNARGTLLTVVTLITALSFQVAVSPPGGFWQDDGDGHVAGTSIMKDKDPKWHYAFYISDWLCFYTSIFLILLLMSNRSLNSGLFKWVFLFCVGNLVMLYAASQRRAHIVGVATGTIAVMLSAALVMYKDWE